MAHHTAELPHSFPARHVVVTLLIFVGVTAIFGMQFKSLSASLAAVQHADMASVAAALGLLAGSYVAAALSYLSLAGKRLSFGPTLVVQIASGLVNRIIPAGLGSVGLYAAYLHKQGYSAAAASAVVATNNLVGIIGNLLLIGLVLLIFPDYLGHVHVPPVSMSVLYGFMVAVLVLLLCYPLISRARSADGSSTYRRGLLFLRSAVRALRSSFRPNRATAGSLATNIVLTCLTAAVLCLSVLAVGGTLSWPAAVMVLSLGTLVGAAVPTPGGIGGVEAGLLAGLLAFGAASSYALAGVLLYRLLTYWLPIIPGSIAFRFVMRHYV